MFQWLVFLTATVLWSGTTAIVGQQVAVTELAGGRGGREFTDPPPSPGARILEIQIRAGDTIDAIQVIYLMPDGRTAPGPQHGGRGGNPGVFRLDSDETILGISGRYGDTVDSLRFHTNKRTSPVFGGRGGDRDYRIDVPNGSQFAGFTGRSGSTIDALGLAFVSGYGMDNRRGTGFSNQQAFQQVMETETAGGRGGAPFSDRDIPPGARLVEIRVASSNVIDSIQGIYQLPNGRIVEGERHGGGGGRVTSLRFDSDGTAIPLIRCGFKPTSGPRSSSAAVAGIGISASMFRDGTRQSDLWADPAAGSMRSDSPIQPAAWDPRGDDRALEARAAD
jgi:hypothetical protein